MSTESDGDATAQMLIDVLNTEPPAELESRLRRRLDAFQARIETQTVTPRPEPVRRRGLQAAGVAAVLLAAVLLAIMLPIGGSSRALAQVVEAVAKKTWLHAQGTGPNGERAEMWFSAKHGILGFRSGKSYVLVDQVQQTMDVFGPPADSDSIQRMTLQPANSRGIAAARQSFLALLSGDLQRAMKSGDQQILEHELTPVESAGRKLTEHRFLVGQGEVRTESVLRVDPATELPISWQMRHGDKTLFDFAVSYPDRGPLTIVALGAPEDARTVDQTPSVEFRKILSATTAATRRFDNYRAIVVETFNAEPASAWSLMYRIWRKGNRWRIDRVRPSFQGREDVPAGEDPKVWWLAQDRRMKSFPREIWDGKQFWLFDEVHDEPRRPDPDDERFLRIASLKVTSRQEMDPEDPTSPRHTYELPEFYGYDHLKLGASPGFRAETQTAELNGLPFARVDLINTWSKAPKETSPRRYWLDPLRGFLIVRREYFQIADPNQPVGVSEVVEADQTPQGLWYPTRMRMIGNSISMEDGSRSDTYVRYFLDFDADIPDELFDPKAVDLNDPWTVVPQE